MVFRQLIQRGKRSAGCGACLIVTKFQEKWLTHFGFWRMRIQPAAEPGFPRETVTGLGGRGDIHCCVSNHLPKRRNIEKIMWRWPPFSVISKASKRRAGGGRQKKSVNDTCVSNFNFQLFNTSVFPHMDRAFRHLKTWVSGGFGHELGPIPGSASRRSANVWVSGITKTPRLAKAMVPSGRQKKRACNAKRPVKRGSKKRNRLPVKAGNSGNAVPRRIAGLRQCLKQRNSLSTFDQKDGRPTV